MSWRPSCCWTHPHNNAGSRRGASRPTAGAISRYENGRITPNLDAIFRIAEVFKVSIDYLAVDNSPRRPLHVDDPGLVEQLAQAAELPADARTSLLDILTKNRVKAVVSGQAS